MSEPERGGRDLPQGDQVRVQPERTPDPLGDRPAVEESGAFEYVEPTRIGGGIPWYAAVLVLVLLCLVAAVIDWVLGAGIGTATGAAYVLGCIVLGGRVRIPDIVAGFVAAPACFAVVVVVSGVVQYVTGPDFGTALRIHWTYALLTDAQWLLIGTAVSVLLSAVRLLHHLVRARRLRRAG